MSSWNELVEYGKCPTCGFKHKSKEELKKHIEEHHGFPGYKDVIIEKIDEYGECPTCGFKYKSKEELKKGVEEHRGLPGPGAV
jgi:rubredoxin